MKFFVAFVATLACAVATPTAYSAYTPYAAAPYGAAPYYGSYGYSAPADIKVLPSGYLADTPEVAHAKAAHLAEKAKVSPYSYAAPAAYASYAAPAYSYAAPAYAAPAYAAPAYAAPAYAAKAYAPAYAGAYAYGPAHIAVLPSGYLADTPEVAHSKAAHEVAKSHVAAAAAANPDYTSPAYSYAAPAYSYAAPAYSYAAPAYSYAAPAYSYAPSAYVAKPVVTPGGYLADTPEVAHAKAAHLAVKAAASYAHHGY